MEIIKQIKENINLLVEHESDKLMWLLIFSMVGTNFIIMLKMKDGSVDDLLIGIITIINLLMFLKLFGCIADLRLELIHEKFDNNTRKIFSRHSK